jgi:DNA-binding LacI/PurR family transcriptional regulator
MPKRATLKEVAAHAGVSYQTVSKVLNKQVTATRETEQRIYEAVRILGYHPNLIARNMRLQESRLIGYSWAPSPPDQGNPILDQFLQSMAQATESAGYHLLCFPHHEGQGTIAAYRDLIDTHRVDGFVISSVEYNDLRISFLEEQNFPFVAFGRSQPGSIFPYVDVDGAAGIQSVVEHLVSLGHRRIAVLAWPDGSRVGDNRMEGCLVGIHTAGIPLTPELVTRSEGNFHSGFEATLQLLDLPVSRRPTAIMALNDMMAIGAIRAAQSKGLRVGVDIAIAGFDDMPAVQYLTPSLTSVRQPIREVGQQVISMLVNILNETPLAAKQILIPPQLVIRASTTGNDTDVSSKKKGENHR